MTDIGILEKAIIKIKEWEDGSPYIPYLHDALKVLCKRELARMDAKEKQFNKDDFISGFLCAGGKLEDAEKQALEMESCIETENYVEHIEIADIIAERKDEKIYPIDEVVQSAGQPSMGIITNELCSCCGKLQAEIDRLKVDCKYYADNYQELGAEMSEENDKLIALNTELVGALEELDNFIDNDNDIDTIKYLIKQALIKANGQS